MKGELPLSGVRVIDFTQNWVGPLATRVLADFGAEVIKIEYVRRLCPFRGGRLDDEMYNRHPRWHHLNRNKLSVTLDLNLEEDLSAFKDLVRISDILVNTSRPGVLDRFGLAYPELRRLRPDLIVALLSAFGGAGPLASYAGYGGTIDAESGLQGLTAYRHDGKKYRVREMDVFNGLMGLSAILTALEYRQETGQGQCIDLSQLETATHGLMGEHLLEYVLNGSHTAPQGNRHQRHAPQGCYRCVGEDAWVTLTVRNPAEWESLCRTLEQPEWIADGRFSTVEARRRNHDELDRLIETWTSRHTPREAMELLQAGGVAAGAVFNTADLSQDRHLRAREFFRRSPDGSDKEYLGMLFTLSDGAGRLDRRGPDLGEHNEHVLCDLLGRPRDEVRPVVRDEIGTAFDKE